MQREPDGAGALSRQDFIGTDMAIEHAANPTVGQRHQNVHDTTAGAAIGRLAIGAYSVAEVDDVVVAAVAGKVELAHGVGSKRRRAAALPRALFVGVAERL